MGKRLPKLRRAPESFALKRLTPRSLDLIETIARYRFIGTRDLLLLVGGNEDVTYRHLQFLYHKNLVSRFVLPTTRTSGEFIYFLDNATALRGLTETSRLDVRKIPWEQVRLNHERYSASKLEGSDYVGRFLFINHELMISAFRAELETAARLHTGVIVEQWVQGPPLWSKVRHFNETLPHRPDALFTLRFPNAPEGQQRSNFVYEADRETSNLTKIRQKFIAHLQFFVGGEHSQKYKIQRIRAVLVETISPERASQMLQIAAELAASQPLAGLLFWFSHRGKSDRQNCHLPFPPVWKCAADQRVRSLLD